MQPSPRVTFLIAVHNGAATVEEAVRSVLQQTLKDIEIVIVDDGSTDDSPEIIKRLADPRIRLVSNDANKGLSWSLNRGWGQSRGEYVARMDADDLCMPGRAEKQVAFLDAHPGIAVVGSFVETFGAAGSGRIEYQTDPHAIAATILFRNALAHPAVMIRKAAVDGEGLQFDPRFRAAQDYRLWAQCVARRLGMANLPEVLLRYRLHGGQLSSHFAEGMQGEGSVIRAELLRSIDAAFTDDEVNLHNAISRDQLVAESRWIASAAAWLEKLADRALHSGLFEKEPLMKVLTGRYVALQRFAVGRQINAPDPWQSPFAPFIHAGSLPKQG